MQFNKIYFVLFIIILITEITIAVYLSNGFIRHTFGDALVVMLLYCLLKSFVLITPLKAAIVILIISFSIEFLQLSPLLEWLQLEHNEIAKVILGSTFSITDLIAYTVGLVIVLLIERNFSKKHENF